MYVFAWYCRWSLALVSCSGANTTFLWLVLLHLVVYLPLTPNRSLIWWWTICQSFWLFPTDKIMQGYFYLPSVVMKSSISSCFMFSFIHVSQHITVNDMSMLLLLVPGSQGHLVPGEESPKWPFSWLSLELHAGCWCQVSGSVMAGPGGIAVRFSCGSGRCQSHLDQMMAADLFQDTLRHLFFGILLRCCLSVWLPESVWHACPPTWPVLLWSLPLL